MKKMIFGMLTLSLLLMLLAGCGSGKATVPAEEGAGDPVRGEVAFTTLGCNACHTETDTELAPTLHGIYGKVVDLDGGGRIDKVDDAYLRESIVSPGVKLVKGYGPLMPATYTSLEEQKLLDLIAYIRSLGN
jgi:cytochrome c oxidase subunit 2